MKSYRQLICAISVVCVILAIIAMLFALRNCPACVGEREIAARLGIDGDVTAIGKYMDKHVVLGQTKVEVFIFYKKASLDAIKNTPTLGNLSNVPNASCFRVRFDDMLAGNLLLNRIICFDGDNKLISITPELSFY